MGLAAATDQIQGELTHPSSGGGTEAEVVMVLNGPGPVAVQSSRTFT